MRTKLAFLPIALVGAISACGDDSKDTKAALSAESSEEVQCRDGEEVTTLRRASSLSRSEEGEQSADRAAKEVIRGLDGLTLRRTASSATRAEYVGVQQGHATHGVRGREDRVEAGS